MKFYAQVCFHGIVGAKYCRTKKQLVGFTKMAEKRGIRSRLFGSNASRADEQRKKQMEREREGTVDKKSLFKRVMRSDDGKKSSSSSSSRSRGAGDRDRGGQSFLEFSSKAIDSYETHTDPKKREAEAKRRHEKGETVDRRGKKPGKAQQALKVGRFLHKHSK